VPFSASFKVVMAPKDTFKPKPSSKAVMNKPKCVWLCIPLWTARRLVCSKCNTSCCGPRGGKAKDEKRAQAAAKKAEKAGGGAFAVGGGKK
jgi:hypothetical protein